MCAGGRRRRRRERKRSGQGRAATDAARLQARPRLQRRRPPSATLRPGAEQMGWAQEKESEKAGGRVWGLGFGVWGLLGWFRGILTICIALELVDVGRLQRRPRCAGGG